MTPGAPNRRKWRERTAILLIAAAVIVLPTAALGRAPRGSHHHRLRIARQTQILSRPSFLHVDPRPGPGGLAQIRDQSGRSVLLRGVNVNGLEDYYANSATPTALAYPTSPAGYLRGRCPARNPVVESMAFCSFDAAQLRSFGYDAVRLAVSWSLLEPSPGRIDGAYLDRIAQAVSWLRSVGILSIIDLHQDAWSKFLYTQPADACVPPLSPVAGAHEADGAPAWASVRLTPVCQAAAREVDPAVQEDFQRLWSDTAAADGVGLQEHFAGVVTALARRFADQPAVAGYDLLNEPSPGYMPPPAMDSTEIFPFYAKVIKAVIAGVPGFRQLFFIEPDVTRDVTDQRYAPSAWSSFSSYPNVVYAPHIYTHVFTPDAQTGMPSARSLYTVSAGYASAAADARALGLPLVDGEFGTEVASDPTTLAEHYAEQDAAGIGGTVWVWKADASDPANGFSVLHGPFGRGQAFPSRVLYTARAYPVLTAGTLERMAYDPLRLTFDLRARAGRVRVGDGAHATLLYLPARFKAKLAATGAVIRVTPLAGGAREVLAYPRGGEYRLFSPPVIRRRGSSAPRGP